MKQKHIRKVQLWQHWIQRITFAAETNAACSRGSADTQTHTQTPSVAIPSPLAKRRRIAKRLEFRTPAGILCQTYCALTDMRNCKVNGAGRRNVNLRGWAAAQCRFSVPLDKVCSTTWRRWQTGLLPIVYGWQRRLLSVILLSLVRQIKIAHQLRNLRLLQLRVVRQVFTTKYLFYDFMFKIN